ncbi:Candidapepsin-10 [Spathaspora sp. JA1]|nr:Candidapepsin-10 [Spathaspora sp. JA1]
MQLLSLIAASATLSIVASSPVKVNPGYVAVPIQVDRGATLGQSKETISMSVSRKEQLFLADLEIGSNGEHVTVAVDTGSEYLWVMDSNVECDVTNGDDCKEFGTFSSSDSKSFVKDEDRGEFQVSYLSGKKANGVWGNDDVSIAGSAPVHGFEFGVAQQASSKIGILGLNFPSDGSQGYSLPQKLHEQGIIPRNAYSVFLNSKQAGSGSIMFGAVDHGKYDGDLVTVPVQYDEEFPRVNVSARIDVNYQSNSVDSGKEVGYILDTGSTRSRLPGSYLDTLKQALGGSYDDQWKGISFDSCSKLDALIFYVNFYGKTITVPAKSLDYGTQGDRCLLQLNFNQDNDVFILGMDMLRSIYFLVDLDDREVQLAQARYGDDSKIEVFQSSGSQRLASSKKDVKVIATAAAVEEKTSAGAVIVNPIKAMIMGLLLACFI